MKEKKKRIVVLGDSISQGIGSKKINYISYLEEQLGESYEILNLAHTGTTIDYALNLHNNITEYDPQIILVMYGNVDAQIRPNIHGKKYNIDKIIPRRYKKNGMLDPRPFYSRKWYRYFPDRFDNITRLIIRRFVTKTQGVCQWITADEFKAKYQEFINTVKKDNRKIILVSTIKLDEKYYSGCTEQYKIFNKIIKELSDVNNCKYINLFTYIEELLEKYKWNEIFYFDHYHPNKKGYELIAQLFAKEILK